MILEPCTSSGLQVASAAISTHPGLLCAIDLMPPSTGSAVLKIYDNPTSAAGTILFECSIAAGVGSQSVNMSMARYVGKGIYASLTNASADATYVVGYTVVG